MKLSLLGSSEIKIIFRELKAPGVENSFLFLGPQSEIEKNINMNENKK